MGSERFRKGRQSTAFVAVLHTPGMAAPMIVYGPMNGEVFLTYTKQYLLPTVRQGDIVVMDNLSSHHRPGVRELVESAGCSVVYPPPDSPDLSPVELADFRLKAFLRKHAEANEGCLPDPLQPVR